MSCSFSKAVPAVCIDVDGVLKRGNVPIPSARSAILKLRRFNIPFAILTNNGGETEQTFALKWSKLLKLPKHDYFKANEIVLCHSPMKDALKHYKTKNQLVLVTGNGNIHEVMLNYKCNNFITVNEYTQMFPEIFPFFYPINTSKSHSQRIKHIVSKRIGRAITTYPPIKAVVQLSDMINWEINAQLLTDILISSNGIPGNIRSTHTPQHVDYHLACKDLLFMDKFNLPRFACGSFFMCLNNLFTIKYHRNINHSVYGKPSSLIFNYARNLLSTYTSLPITNFYMIGDNPSVDIRGANVNGYHSILVRTGIFKGSGNSKEYPAKTVCDDVGDAIDYILRTERCNML
jgi:HAD superfamily hydrolase (TIGR01456 family)